MKTCKTCDTKIPKKERFDRCLECMMGLSKGWNESEKELIGWILRYMDLLTTTKDEPFYTQLRKDIKAGYSMHRIKNAELIIKLKIMKDLIEDELRRMPKDYYPNFREK